MPTGTHRIILAPYQNDALQLMGEAWGRSAGVYIVGQTGTGKTLIAERFAKLNVPSRYRKGPGGIEVVDRLILNCLNATLEAHAAMSKVSGARTAWEMAEEAKTASVTVLDDVGRERGEYGRDVVFSLIDQAGGFLILTSNRGKKELAELYGGDEGLRSRLSALVPIEFPADAPNFRKAQND